MMSNQELVNYYQDGNSLAATSKKFDISVYKIKKILQQENIHIRSRHEQCIIENQKRSFKINHYYFDELDDIKAYWLGFLAADGTVRKNRNEIKIGLKAQDAFLLKEFKTNLESEHPLKFYKTKNNYEVVEFRFSSERIKKQLAYYSIVPNKTYIGITMKNIPDKYKLAFIKGFFDGDGSYTANKVKIVSYTENILKEIQDFIPQKSYIYYTNRNLYSLELSTIPSLEFLTSIYSIKTPQLDRKYQKYLQSYKRI